MKAEDVITAIRERLLHATNVMDQPEADASSLLRGLEVSKTTCGGPSGGIAPGFPFQLELSPRDPPLEQARPIHRPHSDDQNVEIFRGVPGSTGTTTTLCSAPEEIWIEKETEQAGASQEGGKRMRSRDM
jgi:hypothetical protein